MEFLLYGLIGFIGGYLISGVKYRSRCAELEELVELLLMNKIKVRILEDEDEL